jgi:hypothetical protein
VATRPRRRPGAAASGGVEVVMADSIAPMSTELRE